MKKNKLDVEIEKALAKKAMGYNLDEVVEEYTVDEAGEEKLIKKKVTKKFVPPDLSSAKVLLEKYKGNEISTMTKEELLRERQRLLKQLKEFEEDEDWKMWKKD